MAEAETTPDQTLENDTNEKLAAAEDNYLSLYEEMDSELAGKLASRQEREEQELTDTSLTFGEIEFGGFVAVFRKLYNYGLSEVETMSKFVDFGSSTGKAMTAAALIHPIKKCVGYEVLSGLVQLHESVLAEWEKNKENYPEASQEVEFEVIHGDGLQGEWSDADVVFVHSTCFDDVLMTQIASQCEKLRKGALVITVTNPLRSEYFQMIEEAPLEANWGTSTAFIQRRYKE